MLKVSDIYYACLDDTSKDSNGNLSHSRFNRLSYRASLRLMSFLVGSPKAETPPLPPSNQFGRDILAPFLKTYSATAAGGIITRPEDYFSFVNLFLLTADTDCEADEDEPINIIKQPIEILSSDKFAARISTWIDELKPTLSTPIAKLNDDGFDFYPADIGNVALTYYRLPAHAEIKTKQDDVYHDQVIDEATSINYDFPEALRDYLIWFIVQQFSIHVRDKSLTELNTINKP